MKRIFKVDGNGKGKLCVYLRKKARKDAPICDIVDIYARNSNGEVFIDCGINKEEAIWLSEGLLRAFNILLLEQINKENKQK